MKPRYALFGHPVGHSRSPGIYAGFAAATGHDIEFELVDCTPEVFADALREFASHGGHGANVTLPHKLAAAGLATALTARAGLAGAVNTLRIDADGVILGDNTDGAGLVADLTGGAGFDLAGRRVLVIGAGGAARGIAGPLLEAGIGELVVANRDAAKAETLAGRFTAYGRVRAAMLSAPGRGYDLVVNATSASLRDELPAIPATVFGPAAFAYDLCYGDDGSTVFTRWAVQHGARARDGSGMLVEQARESWFVWFGEYPSRGSASFEER